MKTEGRIPEFGDLREALEFMVTRLDRGDTQGIYDACEKTAHERTSAPPEPSPNTFRMAAIEGLRDEHERTPLDETFAGRAFPAGETTYKLGGHAAELGHIHIDFRRTGEGWVLDEIWVCR